MKLYYRISDNSYKKQKLIGATKEVCFQNFIKTFSGQIFDGCPCSTYWKIPLMVVADNCTSAETRSLIQTMPSVMTNLGNAGSLRYTLEDAIKEGKDNEIVYFCEDDYLHLDNAPRLIEEGMQRADYVTLYDHPDKYTAQYNGGEFSKVIRTESSHWRYTVSTCMTFATTIGTLKEDLDIWRKYTEGDHPHDHQIFTELGKEKRRRLAVCIPGAACHTDLEYSGRISKMTIEPWAIDLMIKKLESELNQEEQSPDFLLLMMSMTKNKSRWEKLISLDALKSALVK